jgi:hypothetical protein
MNAETIRTPAARKRVPPLEEEDETWLRHLGSTYARALEGPIDIAGLVSRARKLAARIERADVGDLASLARRRHGDELDRGANVLEQLDALRAQILAERAHVLSWLEPVERATVMHHVPAVLAVVDRLPDAAGFEEASMWMCSIQIETLRVLANVVRLERAYRENEDLRRRAYHSLDGLMKRSFGR